MNWYLNWSVGVLVWNGRGMKGGGVSGLNGVGAEGCIVEVRSFLSAV